MKRLSPLYTKLKKEETKNKTALSKIRKLAREVLYALSEYRRANYVSIAAETKWNKSILRKNKKNDLFNLTPTWARSSNRKEIYKILGGLVLEHCNPLSELADDILSKKNKEGNIPAYESVFELNKALKLSKNSKSFNVALKELETFLYITKIEYICGY